MTTILVSKAAQMDKAVSSSLQPRVFKEPVADETAATGEVPAGATIDTVAGNALDEWAVGSACYMCHTCTNFGVQGEEGRPCAKGLSDLIKRRSRARMDAKAARREGK